MRLLRPIIFFPRYIHEVILNNADEIKVFHDKVNLVEKTEKEKQDLTEMALMSRERLILCHEYQVTDKNIEKILLMFKFACKAIKIK